MGQYVRTTGEQTDEAYVLSRVSELTPLRNVIDELMPGSNKKGTTEESDSETGATRMSDEGRRDDGGDESEDGEDDGEIGSSIGLRVKRWGGDGTERMTIWFVSAAFSEKWKALKRYGSKQDGVLGSD
jgi:hypothetical protein